MGCMADAREHELAHGTADAGFDGVELAQRPVLVGGPLHDQNRARDRGEAILDVPGSEVRIEPDVVPSVERVVDGVVMAGEAIAPRRRAVRLTSLPDRRDAD